MAAVRMLGAGEGQEEEMRTAPATLRLLGARPFTLALAVPMQALAPGDGADAGAGSRLLRLRPDADVAAGELRTCDHHGDDAGGSDTDALAGAPAWRVCSLPSHLLAPWDVLELEEVGAGEEAAAAPAAQAFPTGLARSALRDSSVRQGGLVRLQHLNGGLVLFRCHCVRVGGSGSVPRTHPLATTIAAWGLVHPSATTLRVLPRRLGSGARAASAAPRPDAPRALDADSILEGFDADVRALLLAAMAPSHVGVGAAAKPDGATATRSFMLHGPAGGGKRELVRAVAHKFAARVIVVNPSHLFEACASERAAGAAAQRVSASAPPLPIDKQAQRRRRLPRAFELAKVLAAGRAGGAVPVIIMLERLDVLFPRQKAGAASMRGAVGEDDFDILLQFIGCMAELAGSADARGGLLVCGTTDEPGRVHPSARAAFELALQVGTPSPRQRLIAFRAHAAASNEIPFTAPALAALAALSATSHGFEMADVAAVVRDARAAAQQCAAAAPKSALTPGCFVGVEDLHEAARRHCPIALRGGMLQAAAKAAGQGGGTQGASGSWTLVAKPQVSWADVAGQQAAKQALTELVVWPHQHAGALRRLGIAPVRGVLLHGPPGTGKTMLARATASEVGAHFMSVSISQLVRAELGESEKHLASIFALARRCAPCVLFFDEFQALFGGRGGGGGGGVSVSDALSSQLLVELDGLWETDGIEEAGRVMILAATNTPDAIDPAFMRPNRFDRSVLVGPLDADGRLALLHRRAGHARWAPDVSCEHLASLTLGFTGAELAALCRCAAMHAVSDGSSCIHAKHFQMEIDKQRGRC